MLHPSYIDLMEVINAGVEIGEEPVINSRYSIVTATARRARQIVDGAEQKTIAQCNKPFSVSVQELYEGRIHILPEEQDTEETISEEV